MFHRLATVSGSVIRKLDVPTPKGSDLLAGLSVALVLIPQSLAYAEIAGMPLYVGLFASTLPPIVFALFASSPYLQTGPVAMTSLLTLGALQGAGYQVEDPNYVKLGGLLAVIVAVVRLGCGLLRMGWVAYLISDPVMIGFTSGAAVVIMASQFPKSVGISADVPDGSPISEAWWALLNPQLWSPAAVALCLTTVVFMVGGRKVHRLFPGVLIAVIVGLAVTAIWGYSGPTVGQPDPAGTAVSISQGLPQLSFDLPWGQTGSLLVGGIVIAFVGFAEPSAIARVFANEDGTTWNPNREMISSAFANVAAGLSGAYPVGGSFSRSSINRLAGAQTRWSGGVTGLVVLAFLGVASVLEALPLAVLGGIVLAAVYRLLKPMVMAGLWQRSVTQAALAWVTFLITVLFTPNVHWAVLVGVSLSIVHHFMWRFKITSKLDNNTLVIKPSGLLWVLSRSRFDRQLRQLVEEHKKADLVVDLAEMVTVDVATVEVLANVAADVAGDCTFITINGPGAANKMVSEAADRVFSDRAKAVRP